MTLLTNIEHTNVKLGIDLLEKIVIRECGCIELNDCYIRRKRCGFLRFGIFIDVSYLW